MTSARWHKPTSDNRTHDATPLAVRLHYVQYMTLPEGRAVVAGGLSIYEIHGSIAELPATSSHVTPTTFLADSTTFLQLGRTPGDLPQLVHFPRVDAPGLLVPNLAGAGKWPAEPVGGPPDTQIDPFVCNGFRRRPDQPRGLLAVRRRQCRLSLWHAGPAPVYEHKAEPARVAKNSVLDRGCDDARVAVSTRSSLNYPTVVLPDPLHLIRDVGDAPATLDRHTKPRGLRAGLFFCAPMSAANWMTPSAGATAPSAIQSTARADRCRDAARHCTADKTISPKTNAPKKAHTNSRKGRASQTEFNMSFPVFMAGIKRADAISGKTIPMGDYV